MEEIKRTIPINIPDMPLAAHKAFKVKCAERGVHIKHRIMYLIQCDVEGLFDEVLKEKDSQ